MFRFHISMHTPALTLPLHTPNAPRDLFPSRGAVAEAALGYLCVNKAYIILAGVLSVPLPNPFRGFMEGLWIVS